MKLNKSKCEPCQLGTPPMDRDKALEQLNNLDSGWELSERSDMIIKKWKFKNYSKALKTLNLFAEIAESEDHHPVMTLSWGQLVVSIKTDKSGGLTINDFVLAAKYDHHMKEET